jgi:hypothetical protein
MATLFVVYEYDSKMSAIIGTGSRAVLFCIAIRLAGMCRGVGK